MLSLVLITSLATLPSFGTPESSNLIKCNCTSILMPGMAISKLMELVKNMAENGRASSDAFTIVNNISAALNISEQNESSDVLPQITNLVVNLLENTDTSNLGTTVEALQELQSILSSAESSERASSRIITVIQFIVNLFFKILNLILGGKLRASDGQLTADGRPVDQETINRALGNQLLQQIVNMMTKLLRNILDMSSTWGVTNILDRVNPLLESLLGSIGGGMHSVTKAVLGVLDQLLEKLPGALSDGQPATEALSSDICAHNSLTVRNNTIRIPITQTIEIGDLNSTLNNELAAIAKSSDLGVSKEMTNLEEMQKILNDVARSESITADQAERLMPLISTLTGFVMSRGAPTININSQSETSANPISTHSNINLMPAIQRDLQDTLQSLGDISESPSTQTILSQLRRAINDLTGNSNPIVGLIRVLILSYRLLGAVGSGSSSTGTASPANRLVTMALDSLTTITPTSGGISSSVALLTSFINLLYERGRFTLEQVISILKKLIANGQITTRSLLDVLSETLTMIPNLPSRIEDSLHQLSNQLANYGNVRGSDEGLIRSLEALREALDSTTGSARRNYEGVFQWLINVLVSIFSGNTRMRNALEVFRDPSVRVSSTASRNCDSTSLFGALICPISNLVVKSSQEVVGGVNSIFHTLLGVVG